MHMKASDKSSGPRAVPVRFILEDPRGLTGEDQAQRTVMAAVGQNMLEIALDAGINIEHACGGVCACSTCHVYLEQGEDICCDAEDEELDRVEEAPGLQQNSRLSCQTIIEQQGPITIKVPAWNRNAVKEAPH